MPPKAQPALSSTPSPICGCQTMSEDSHASNADDVSTTSTPLSDHAPVEPAPERERLKVTYKRHRRRDPYIAAVSGDAYIAPHHVLTLASKATRLGQSIYHAGARSFNHAASAPDSSPKNDADIDAREVSGEAASIRTVVSVHMPHWMRDFTARRSRQQSLMPLLSFRNPWSSFQPPGLMAAMRGGLRWGLPQGYVEGGKHSSRYRSRGRTWQETQDELDEVRVRVDPPQWDKHSEEEQLNNIRVTWLGHATTLVQLPNGINILFDPIFVQRASPSQSAGPIRFTAPPCKIEDLPDIDIVCISHNHYDHLSWDCIKKLRKRQKTRGGLHVFCPLGNVGFFREAHFDKDEVNEMDWWDEAEVSRANLGGQIKVICTPAQHGSGRGGNDQCISLWSSWLIAYKDDSRAQREHRIFFAGDSGLRSRDAPRRRRSEYPACPVFREISLRFGVPQVLLLPISVGSSLSYFRGWDPFPRRWSPFPRVESTMTSAIHMDAEDAAECHAIMSLTRDDSDDARKAREDVEHTSSGSVTSIAVHYGTFVRNEQQTHEDVRLLRRACRERGIAFVRRDNERLQDEQHATQASENVTASRKGRFLVSNQGETVFISLAREQDPPPVEAKDTTSDTQAPVAVA